METLSKEKMPLPHEWIIKNSCDINNLPFEHP